MSLLLIMSIIAQIGSGSAMYTNKPVLAVTGTGNGTISIKATEYKMILYADSFDEEKEEAHRKAESMRKAIIKLTKEIGGKEDDVVLLNLNTLDPIEEDPFYRVEQDIQVTLKNVKDINKLKEKYLLINGTQFESLTPLVRDTGEYGPAVAKARKDAIENARKSAQDLAEAMNVTVGEALYVSENVTYPRFDGYETLEEAEVTVSVTIHFEMLYNK